MLFSSKSKESMLDCVLFARDKWLRPGRGFFGPQILRYHFGQGKINSSSIYLFRVCHEYHVFLVGLVYIPLF